MLIDKKKDLHRGSYRHFVKVSWIVMPNRERAIGHGLTLALFDSKEIFLDMYFQPPRINIRDKAKPSARVGRKGTGLGQKRFGAFQVWHDRLAREGVVTVNVAPLHFR